MTKVTTNEEMCQLLSEPLNVISSKRADIMIFHFYVDKQWWCNIPCPSSHGEVTISESLEAFPLEPPSIDFFFFFKLAFLRTRQIYKVKNAVNLWPRNYWDKGMCSFYNHWWNTEPAWQNADAPTAWNC